MDHGTPHSHALCVLQIHEVSARRFCLVAADHPLVSAISENAEKLQMGFVLLLERQLPHIALIHFLWMAVRFL